MRPSCEDWDSDEEGEPESVVVSSIPGRERKGYSYAEQFARDFEASFVRKFRSQENLSRLDEIERISPGPSGEDNDTNEKLINIKRKYFNTRPQRPSPNLAIKDFKNEILQTIDNNNVVVITGPTGCGKSTQIPQFILESKISNFRYCNIAVTQPRRISAMSIARRVCAERDWEVGSVCGYKIGLLEKASHRTLLTFMTTGVLLQMLIQKRSLSQFTHIIIDEIHERDQSIDLLLIVIKKLLMDENINVKIILMSATIEAEKFAKYFPRKVDGAIVPAHVLKVCTETNYSIDLHYLDDMRGLGEIPVITLSDTRIPDISYNLCVALLKDIEKKEVKNRNKSTILIFLPGIFEIERLYNKLQDPKVNSDGYKWNLLPLHSSITFEEQRQVFVPPKYGERKIILSTNIAESSITVPNARYVIDFCLVKRFKNDVRTKVHGLELCWASQANCNQRAGRVGRVQNGHVYRMVSKVFFSELPKEGKPELLDGPLEKVILQTKVLDMGEPKELLALALDPPDLADIEWSILVLKEMGALLRYRNGVYVEFDGDITLLGRMMALLPLDIHITKLILLGHIFGLMKECLIIGACMSVKSVFSQPFRNRLEAYNLKRAWAENSSSDCIAFLNVYNLWSDHIETGYFKKSKESNEVSWAKRNFVQLKVLDEVKLLIRELRNRLKEYEIEDFIEPEGKFENDNERLMLLKLIISGAFYPNYFGPGHEFDECCELKTSKSLGGANPFTTVMLHSFPHHQPLQLYYGVIKDYYAKMGAEVRVYSNGYTKAFVEFRRMETKIRSDGTKVLVEMKPGKIPEGLYRALKAKQLRKKVNLKLLPLKDTKERIQRLGIHISNKRPKTRIPNFKPCPLPSVDTQSVEIVISHIIDPGHFWALYADSLEIRQNLHRIIKRNIAKCKPFKGRPPLGVICIAPLQRGKFIYFQRARIESLEEISGDLYVQVFFVDQGSREMIEARLLKRIEAELSKILRKIPGQAFECILSELRPSSIWGEKDEWSKAAFSAFKTLIRGGKLVGRVYSVVRNVVAMELYKIDTNQTRLCINDALIKKKYARFSEEIHSSKLNHSLRVDNMFDGRNKEICNGLQKEDPWPACEYPYLSERERTEDAHLKGPTCSLEMAVHGFTRDSIGKAVAISEDSVNSVLLNTEPWDRNERLLVAGSVSQNADSCRLILNNTTVMPNIHGFPSIIPLVFTPTAEFRTNKRKTRFIGALCGLGPDARNESLFPEHDMYLHFDTEFKQSDWALLNQLRLHMSMLLMQDVYMFNKAAIMIFQKKCRKLALKLLMEERDDVDIDYVLEAPTWLNPLRHGHRDESGESRLPFFELCVWPFLEGVHLVRDEDESEDEDEGGGENENDPANPDEVQNNP